nr:AIM24 family protein [Agitococcus sp.]
MSEISYQILGSDLQYVEVTLPPQCSVIGEQGAMMYMDNYLEVKTILGDGNGLFSAIKRSLTGESLFSSLYTNNNNFAQR